MGTFSVASNNLQALHKSTRYHTIRKNILCAQKTVAEKPCTIRKIRTIREDDNVLYLVNLSFSYPDFHFTPRSNLFILSAYINIFFHLKYPLL